MPQIYLYRDPVDFRKSYRGLAAIVEQELGHNPFDGDLYAFTNRQRNKVKQRSKRKVSSMRLVSRRNTPASAA